MSSKAKLIITLAAVLILLAGCSSLASALWPEPEALQVYGTPELKIPDVPEEVPEPTAPAGLEELEEEYPDVYPGDIEEYVYTNESIGLSFTLPEGWKFADEETIDMMMGAGMELIAENGGHLDTAGISAIYDMVAYNTSSDSNVMVMIETLTLEPGTELPTATDHLDGLQERLEEMDVFGFVFGQPFSTAVSGENFDALPVTVDLNETPTRQYYLVRIQGRHMVTIIASLFDDIAIEELIGFFG